jgi:hypothetical protein
MAGPPHANKEASSQLCWQSLFAMSTEDEDHAPEGGDTSWWGSRKRLSVEERKQQRRQKRNKEAKKDPRNDQAATDDRFAELLSRKEDELLNFVAQINKVYQDMLKKDAPFMTFVFCGMQSAGKR